MSATESVMTPAVTNTDGLTWLFASRLCLSPLPIRARLRIEMIPSTSRGKNVGGTFCDSIAGTSGKVVVIPKAMAQKINKRRPTIMSGCARAPPHLCGVSFTGSQPCLFFDHSQFDHRLPSILVEMIETGANTV